MLSLQQALGNQATARLLRAPEIARQPAPAAGVVGSPEAPQGSTTQDRDLQSPRFAGDPVLENCLDGKQSLKIGSSGAAVVKVQQALIDAGFPLPRFGPDGRFGGETHDAVKAFQIESGLTGKNVDGIVGHTTMGLLDVRFLAAPPQPVPPGPAPQPVPPTPPQPGTCKDGAVNNDKDPLPDVPPFVPQLMPGDQVLEEVKKMLPPDQPMPKTPPLGATQPELSQKPVTVTAIPVTGSSCVKCAANWDVAATIRVLIATGSIFTGEKRFAVFQPGSVSGCPPQPLAQLLEVRGLIRPEAVPFIVAGEMEHYLDFVRAFRMAAGRFLANVRRLTPDRTHLFASSAAECDGKVEAFLHQAIGPTLIVRSFLREYSENCIIDFIKVFSESQKKRDATKAHSAEPRPPFDQKPIFPDIDLDKNPFGCRAFARKFDQRSFPGIPGPPSDVVIVDQNAPPRRPWHVM